MIPAFHLTGPGAAVFSGRPGTVPPLLLASPHSGTHLPADFLAVSRVTAAELRRVEDAHVDRLLDGAVAAGAPLLRATHARAVIDLNRAEDEIDPGLLVGGARAARLTERVRSGYGLLPRIVAPGRDIYSRRLTHAEAEARIALLHRPWHRAIDTLMARIAAAHGFALLLDCHSMPTPPARREDGRAAEIVLGTLHGRSAAAPLVAAIADHLRAAGWRVAFNDPYAGGHTTQRHADPANNRHAVQIEVDRALYMDPATLEPHAGFARVAAMFEGLTRMLLRDVSYLLSDSWREAAE